MPARPTASGPLATSALPAEILERARQHLAEVAKAGPEWKGATLANTAQPIYRPDLPEIAYYEIPVKQAVRPAGYMILATGPHDMPIVQWADAGKPPIAELAERAGAGRTPNKYYMLDALSFVAENAAGDLVATLGELPSVLMQTRSVQTRSLAPTSVATWKERKDGYVAAFGPALELLRQEAASAWQHEPRPGQATPRSLLNFGCDDDWKYHWAGDHEQRWYSQIDAKQAPNTSNCASGCGATAWAMLFGWADYKAARGESPWQFSSGLYRTDGSRDGDPAAEAAKYMDAGIRNMMWEIRKAIETECATGGQGRTWQWDMEKAQSYLDGRTPAKLKVEYYKGSNLVPSTELRDKADKAIRGGRPVILALGWEHYVLAYGYRKKACKGFDKHEFKINEGWGLKHGRWTSSNTWFVGQLYPAPNPHPPESSSEGPSCASGKKCCQVRHDRCVQCIDRNKDCP